MVRHIVVDPGMLPLESLKGSFKEFSSRHNLTLFTETRRKAEFSIFNDVGIPVLFYESFYSVKNSRLNSVSLEFYDAAISKVLNDSRTLLIAERVNKIHYWNSLFGLIPLIENIIFNFLFFHQEHKIDSILFQATPHNLPNWILANTAEVAGIAVTMIQTSPLPWRYWIVKGIDTQVPFFPKHIDLSESDIQEVDSYIALNKNDYQNALPDYEKVRLDSRRGKYWSWVKEIKDIFNSPRKLLFITAKYRSYQLYRKLSKYPSPSVKYIVFFLHFQPERTSLPEGYIFANQWLIIRRVAAVLPVGVKLYIKEHPSVFTNYFDTRYRDDEFYNRISQLSNVQLIPLSCNTFDLIDNSHGILTITGTVGVQSIIRNKPVIVFGVAAYRQFRNVFFVSSLNSLKEALSYMLSHNNCVFLPDELYAVLSTTVNGMDSKSRLSNYYDSHNRVSGHIEIILSYLKYESEY